MMRLLLDTHTAIWAVSDRQQLPKRILDLLGEAENEVFFSAVSVWEIAIKFSLRRPSSPSFSGRQAQEMFLLAGFRPVEVTLAHAAAVDQLPPIHGDPFDRLILAQALAEPMRLVTHDKALAAYSDTVIAF